MMEKEQMISQIEQALDLAFGALLAGDAQALASNAEVVLEACQALATTGVALDSSWAPSVRRLQQLREAIIRHQVLNAMKLQQLVPAFAQPTYGTGVVVNARPASPYAAGLARASGRLERALRA